MSCPLYGKSATSTRTGALLVSVPYNSCGLTEYNVCDMELQGFEVDWERCTCYRLHLQDARHLKQGSPPVRRKGPGIELVPPRKETWRKAWEREANHA